MRHTSPIHSKSAGFTLVEMLAIAPIIVLVLATFIGLMINMTGDILASTGRNKLVYDTDQALDRMDRDIQNSVSFPATSLTPAAGQGVDPATAYQRTPASFSGSSIFSTTYGALILRQVATDKNPLDPTRNTIYKKNTDGSCSTNPYLYDVIYFPTMEQVTTVNGPTYLYHWWRRVLFDTASQPCTGQTPWQKPTCAAGQTGANCKANDEEWGSDGPTVYGVAWFYADIPDSTTNMFVDADWIDPYKNGGVAYSDGTTPCTSNPPVLQPGQTDSSPCKSNIFDPNSPTTGKNAKSIYLTLGTATSVAGKIVDTTQFIYSTRKGNL